MTPAHTKRADPWHGRTPPKVLQVIPELATGGAERTAIDVSRAVKDAGGRAYVASQGGRMVAELEALGIDHFTLPLATKSPLGIWANAGLLAQLVREEAIEIIHVRSRAPAWSAWLAAKRTNAAFVTTYHGAYSQKLPLKAIYNSIMARGDVSIANSHFIADLMQARHGTKGSRIEIIHRGTPLAAFAPDAVTPARIAALREAWRIDADQPVILNVARLTDWKGQAVILRALGEVATRDTSLFGDKSKRVMVFAGDHQGREAYRQSLIDLALELGISDQVRFVGHVDDTPAAHAIAQMAIVASIKPEAFGRAAVEAQAAGLPVVVSDLGAAPETVLAPPDVDDHGRTGWRVPPNDPLALADAIQQVMHLSPTARSDLAARARRHVEANFSLQVMLDKTLEVYRRVLSLKKHS